MTSDYDTLLRIVRDRRSIRSFRSDSIPQQLVEQMLEAARWAPSAGNRQAYRLMVVASREKLAAMSAAVRASVDSIRSTLRPSAKARADAYLDNFSHFDAAPLCIVSIYRAGVDLLGSSSEAASGESNAAADVRRAESDALCSVSAAIQNLLLGAHALGLGACWMTGPLVAAEALERLLAVPRGWRISALIPIGYPVGVPPPPARRPLERLLILVDGAASEPQPR